MHALVLGLILTFAAPAEPAKPAGCLEVDGTKAEQTTPDGLASTFGVTAPWARVGSDYVACEIEQGNVEEILFLEGNIAVSVLNDGTRVQFTITDGKSGWLAAKAASAGVTITASETLAVPRTSVDGKAAGSGANPLGVAMLVGSMGGGAFLLWRWGRRRPSKVAVQGVTSDARVKRTDIPDTRFADVAGCQEAIEDLQEIVEILKHPERFDVVGARTPKGALLSGPPGTGKTLLARAVAGEAGVPFFSAAGSDFVEMYVGVGARRVRDMFEKARKAGGGIVFIDEIDAVGRRRSDGHVSGGDGETENTLISLLNELDGFRGSNVVVLAATNRPDVLDPALMRPGRLDRRVHVGLPDRDGREAILKVHTRTKPLRANTDLGAVARRTPGMSGAQLEQICNEAALLTARDKRSEITEIDFARAVEYVVMGRPRRSARVDENDRLVTAWHEAGHAVCALRQPGAEPPVAISIVPRGDAGGVTWMNGSDSQIISRSQLRAQLVVALGGRVAEERLLDGEHTAGAANDLEQASQIARTMVNRFGMTARGLTVRHTSNDSSDDAVELLLQSALAEARLLLTEHYALLTALAEALLEREDLDREAIDTLASMHPGGL